MVNEIPIFKVEFAENLIEKQAAAEKLFGYCIEANKGPVGVPIYVSSNSEAMRIFGVNFAPHFYQKGSGIIICRVEFPNMVAPSLTYQARKGDANSNFDAVKITAKSPGTAKHQVNIIKSPTSNNSYNLTVTIEGVGSKKYQSLPNLASVVKRINDKFSDYLEAELLFDEATALTLASGEGEQSLVKNDTTGEYSVMLSSEVESGQGYHLISKGPFTPSRLVSPTDGSGQVNATLTGGSNGKLRKTNGTVSNMQIPDSGLTSGMDGTGTGTNDPNVDTTLLYAYRDAFKKMEDYDLIGIATLSNSEVVQNELVEHINEMIDPETYKYRMGITGFLDYPTTQDGANVDADALAAATPHIDNPFVVMIGQGVVFEEDGKTYDLLPYQAVQLYTGLRSALGYGEAIFGGNPKKVLTGVKDVKPLITNGEIITKEDYIKANEAGLITFKKEYGEVTFLEGVTTAQNNPVLSHESVMMIVLHVLKRLVRVSKVFQGENVTEDLKTSLINALSNELKNITDTDGTLVALQDYNIPPYAVDVQSTVMAGFNDAGEYIRESHYWVTVKIVPVGALRSITLSVIVI